MLHEAALTLVGIRDCDDARVVVFLKFLWDRELQIKRLH